MVQPMSSWGSSVTCLSNVDGGLMDVEMGYLPPMVFPPIVAIGGSFMWTPNTARFCPIRIKRLKQLAKRRRRQLFFSVHIQN